MGTTSYLFVAVAVANCIIVTMAAPVTSSTTSQEEMDLDQLFEVLEDSISRDQAENDQSHLGKARDLNMEEEIDEEIFYTAPQLQQMVSPNRVKRKISNEEDLLWPGGIVYYEFDGTHTEEQKTIVKSAMWHIESETCIRFIDISDNNGVNRASITILRIGEGRGSKCQSHVGRAEGPGEVQLLNLGYPCFYKLGILVHELSHVLGLWHEHQRPNRDEHIQVRYENMRFGYFNNFNKASSREVQDEFPYDYTSVTHYALKDNGRTEWTQDGRRSKLDVIVPLDDMFVRSMGQRLHLSFIDAHAINQLYCRNRCPSYTRPTCYNGGYEDPNNCGSCKCPSGIKTPYCITEVSAQSNPQYVRYFNSGNDCGGMIDLQDKTENIISPGYRYYREYDTDMTCTWLVNAPIGYKVTLRFYDYFGVYMDTSTGSEVCLHWVQVQTDKTRYHIPGPRFCGTETPSRPISSVGNQMLIVFQSNYTVPTNRHFHRTGFKLQLTPTRDESYNRYQRPIASTSTSTTTSTTSTTSTTTTPTTTTTTSTTRRPTTTTEVRGSYNYFRQYQFYQLQQQQRQQPQMSWSDWSECDRECKCGGFSRRTRQRLCDGNICTGSQTETQEQACDTKCRVHLVMVAGTIYNQPGQCSDCAPGWRINLNDQDKCIPS